MSKIFVPPNCCNVGDILADEVITQEGITLVVKNTVVNQYIIDKFTELKIPCVWLFQPAEFLSHQESETKFKMMEKTYKDVVLNLKGTLYDLAIGGKMDYEKSIHISKDMIGGIDESNHIIKCVTRIKDSDEYTYTHCANVALYSMLIAKWLELPEDMIQEAIQAALLHDIGKVNIPEEILNKKGQLTNKEFEEIKKHPMYGYNFIKDISNISETIKMAVLSHHERMDGSGYPYGITKDSISLVAKIISVADVYDAMTQNRVYKNKASPFDAFEMFLTIGKTTFDSTVLKAFLKNMAGFYIGAKVMLSNGDIGEIVYVPPEDIINPIISVGSNYRDISEESGVKILSLL